MQKVEDMAIADTLNALLSSSVTGVVEKSDDAFAAIKSFQSNFKQISRTPEMMRIMLQAEFNFSGMVDSGALKNKIEIDNLLKEDWYDCSFVVVDYSNVETWLKKCIDQADRGRTVVALVPSRTNTAWFHDLVLEMAEEIRFVKGRVQFTGSAKPSTFPDALIIYRRIIKKRARPSQKSVAILKCSTSFTSDQTDFGADVE